MSKIPFEKFIIALLFSNKSIPSVVDKLKSFHYYIKDEEVKEIFDDIRNILPENIKETINAGNPLIIDDPVHTQWLKQFDVYEVYDFMHKKSDAPYIKWLEDITWCHTYEDVMCLVNILMFNGEELESISDIISFKYRKKIGFEALTLYKKVFWNCDNITAKEALYHCLPFRESAIIIRKIKEGTTQIGTIGDDSNDCPDMDNLFHDSNYIKWKIGYKDVKIPTAKEFFESVKRDSYFKYKETMNMTQSVETFSEDGKNDKIGAFEVNKISRRNVEEQKAKLSKLWLDMYLKANESAPEEGEQENFFKQLEQVSLDFTNDEKIVNIDDAKEILEDIKGDL